MMFLFACAALACAVLIGLAAFQWGWCRRAVTAARERSERMERKLDLLLRHLALDEERAGIDALMGRGDQRDWSNSLSTEPPTAASSRSTRRRA